MKSLDGMKLAMNNKAEVVVIADVTMKSDEDIDSLFLNFFTLLNPPIRLSVLGVGCLSKNVGSLVNVSEGKMNDMLMENPDLYANLLQTNTPVLLENAEEFAKIELNSDKNAQNVRAILASMLSNGYYIQKVRYHFPSGIQKQNQKVDVSQLKPAFQQMLQIAKRWDDADYISSLIEGENNE